MSAVAQCGIQEAGRLFCTTEPFALLDVREQEEFARGHLLLASCAPLSRIEFLVEKLVPCKNIPVILMDGGEEASPSRARRAALILGELGYARASVLEGGLAGWRRAGGVAVTGVGSLSKGFGEYVESRQNTPCLSPEEVKSMRESGADLVIIDVRPREEYLRMHIPGGINAPGCEAAYRFLDLVPNPGTRVVINCAGRTRSIIGTQTLRNLGVPNPVAALKGGTMNWRLSGYTLGHDALVDAAPPSARALEFAVKKSAALAKGYGVNFVEAETLRQWQAEAAAVPLYLFDVRQPDEYRAGHLPGARNAPGGQLVQATDEYAAVRNARFVLTDDTEARAVITAHWLLQMSIFNVYVLRGGIGGSGLWRGGLERGAEPEIVPELRGSKVRRIDAAALAELLKASEPPLVVNVGFSDRHKAGHIPGAAWAPRAFLQLCGAAYPNARALVFTSDNEIHAGLAARDATRLWPERAVYALAGGTPAWAGSGRTLQTGMPLKLCAEDDIWYRPYMDVNAAPEAMQGYFDWEFGLVDNILQDGCVSFNLRGA